MFRVFCILAILSTTLIAQSPDHSNEIVRVGPGVTPPRLLHKTEPEYSESARADHVQGTVVIQIVVDEKGRPTDVTLLSPLGFGLDEQALAAVKKWQFAPGMKDGKPVKILGTVEVNFRFPDIWFDEKAERRRTNFNVDVQTLNRPSSKPDAVGRAITEIQELARQKYPPAMYAVGQWEVKGEHVSKQPEDGLALLQKAAEKNYGLALYEVALRRIDGDGLPKDADAGFEEMRRAAVLGSGQAEFYLGSRYEKGDGVPHDAERARRYFRLCASRGVAMCQYRLGRLLLDEPDRPDRDYVQAVAWFQLAADQGLQDAKNVVANETAKLTASQSNWVNSLKVQLVRK